MSEEQKTPTIDELIELPWPGDAQISPDGEWIAYTITRPDWKANEFVSQVWLVPVGGGESRQLTFAKASSRSPRWSPDGIWMAFLSKREGDEHTQVYRLSPFGGESERLTEHETDVSAFAWSPDSRTIAYIAPDSQSEVEKQREETYGEYHIEDDDQVRSHLWLVRLSDKQSIKLTHGSQFHVVGMDWNPFQGWIAFEAWPSPDETNFDRGRIYLLDLDSQGVTLLSDESCSTPRWSPDGARLAFLHLGEPTYYANNTIRVISFTDLPSPHDVLAGSQPTQTVRAANVREPAAFEETAPPQVTVPMNFDEEMQLEDWGLDGLYCTAVQRTEIHLFRVDPDSGIVTRLTPNDPHGWAAFGVSFNKDFSRASLVAFDQDHYGEIKVLYLGSPTNPSAGIVQRLTDYNELTQGWNVGQNEVIRWKSMAANNGEEIEIEGVLTKPADFDPQKKYPLLVLIHGGPTGVSLIARLVSNYSRRIYPMYAWLAHGALILQPNYRGSAGYGEAFRALNVRNLGLGDCADVVSGVDALVERGWVNPEQVGVMGWSQGGYISAFCTTYASDRFRAASVGAGISNWVTYYANTDIHPFTRQYLGANPWEDMEIYRSTSPMTYIQRAHTPTLIQHGTADQRVPLPNAFELYQGLRDMGVETRLVTYPGMPHGPNKPRTCREIMQENLSWFKRWIWDEPAEASKSSVGCYVAVPSEQPGITGELPEAVRDVQRQARRDGVDFCLFSPREGLVRAAEPFLFEPTDLSPDTLLERAHQVAEQLRAEKISRLVVFSADDRPSSLTQFILSCLHLAAGMAGDVKIEHRAVGKGSG